MLALADPWSILLLALALDAILGDPRWLYRAVPHPVVLMGRAVAALEARWNDLSLAPGARMRRGLAATCLVTGAAGALGWLIEVGLEGLAWGWLAEAVLARGD